MAIALSLIQIETGAQVRYSGNYNNNKIITNINLLYVITGVPYDVKPGICVIINNMKFTQGKNLPAAKKDEDRLLVLFKTLDFDVRIHQNLTAQEMTTVVRSYSTMQHEGVFFLIILSHGTLLENIEAVAGTDGESVTIHQLKTFFHANNCPSLRGVPKIFFIDACRGSQEETITKFEPTRSMVTRY